MPERTMLAIQATPDVANIRTATLFDEEHTVVPCVALVEGVLWPANAPAPELALAEEFARFPDSWNGRPVTFDHPKINGTPVSASDPRILEDVGFGQLFNTVLDGVKLKTEIWINNDRVKAMSDDVQDTVERLKAGEEVIEVSTALFTVSEEVEGEFDGEKFEAVWRNIVPDHLAVLPPGVTGACSVEDGCGAPRSNKSTDQKVVFTSKDRKHDFIPVMNAARVEFPNQSGTTIDTDSCETCEGECTCEKKGTFQKIMEAAGDMASYIFAFRDSAKNISDADVRTAIASELSNTEDFFFIMAVFDEGDGSGTFVFESFMENKLFRQTFSITRSKVTIGDKKTEVRPVTQFVAVSPTANASGESETETPDGSIQENSTMNKDQLVQGLIDNESLTFTDDDRDWLTALDESQLAKMSPVVNEEEEEEEEELTADEIAANAAAAVANEAPVTTEAYIADAPPEVQSILNQGLTLQRARRKMLSKGILANARNQFTQEQLDGKPLGELASIAHLATDMTFEAANVQLGELRGNEGDDTPEAPQVFDLSQRASA